MRAGRFAALALLALLAGSAGAQPPPVVDGQQKPQQTEVSYRFSCGTNEIKLSYSEQWRNLASVDEDIGRAHSVGLKELKVSSRPLEAASLAAVQAAIHRFAWVERVTAECFGADITLFVQGMDLERWAASFRVAPEGSNWKRPAATVRTIHISGDATISVS